MGGKAMAFSVLDALQMDWLLAIAPLVIAKEETVLQRTVRLQQFTSFPVTVKPLYPWKWGIISNSRLSQCVLAARLQAAKPSWRAAEMI
ncbi:hypothetical protein ACJRO7_024721 [Eucalyptus globulus]|uniref:Uncharacterized protein n=1 Tax=Eucalyptus globulus TaxID=34317 RepID=A0ABD3KAJ5_EUCGL